MRIKSPFPSRFYTLTKTPKEVGDVIKVDFDTEKEVDKWYPESNKGFPSNIHLVGGHPFVACQYNMYTSPSDMYFYEVIPDMGNIQECKNSRWPILTWKTKSCRVLRKIRGGEPEYDPKVLTEMIMEGDTDKYARIMAVKALPVQYSSELYQIAQDTHEDIDMRVLAISKLSVEQYTDELLSIYTKSTSRVIAIRHAVRSRFIPGRHQSHIMRMWNSDVAYEERYLPKK